MEAGFVATCNSPLVGANKGGATCYVKWEHSFPENARVLESNRSTGTGTGRRTPCSRFLDLTSRSNGVTGPLHWTVFVRRATRIAALDDVPLTFPSNAQVRPHPS